MEENEESSLIDQGSAVHLSAYDAINTTFSHFLRYLGLGFYHSCVQVHGRKYMFKGGDGEESGIVSGQQDHFPWCEGLNLQASILIGQTRSNPDQVQFTIQELADDYPQNSYNVLTNNCNHFSDLLCQLLTGNPIPLWVNRASQFGGFCGCMMPVAEVNAEVKRIALISANCHDPNDGYDGDGDDDDDHDGSSRGTGGGGDDDDDDDWSLRRLFQASKGAAAETSSKAIEDNNEPPSLSSFYTNMPGILRKEDAPVP